ncbi:MAG: PQQ-dependent sugar dehydrogenase [Actinomycetota bacterium]|nr:PQQ-dependent sugar dehydrogenase [Actinomycetota bacterium]
MRVLSRRAISALAVTALMLVPGPSAAVTEASRLASGFRNEVVAQVPRPTALGFLPDGTVLVATVEGTVRLIDPGGAVRGEPVLDFRDRVCTEGERGMAGLAVDPAFASNRRIYVSYTFRKFRGCPIQTPDVPVNRVSRFVLEADGTVESGNETVLIDNVPSFGGTHNAGDLRFGPDGYLYVGMGDGGRDYQRRTNRSADNPASRDKNVLLGKVLRVTADGEAAPDNPFNGPGSTACARRGVAPPGAVCREIYGWAFRNPFRMAFTADGRLVVNDVGQTAWEEVNVVAPGADYGWPLREGPCHRDGRVRCGPAPPSMTDPVYSYAHRRGCSAITAGAFVPQTLWPARFRGSYLYADLTCGIWAVRGLTEGSPRSIRFASGSEVIGVVAVEFRGADLYYASLYRDEIRRIRYVGR